MLNARPQYIRREAKVIAQAGLPGVVTIATNMAGRGVDILMGGNPQGLAQMALEQLVFKQYLTGGASSLSPDLQQQSGWPSPVCTPTHTVSNFWGAEEEWALEYEDFPSSKFREFSSEEEMLDKLPPQLYGAIKRVQVRPAELATMLPTHVTQMIWSPAPESRIVAGHTKVVRFPESADDVMPVCLLGSGGGRPGHRCG